MFFSKAVNFCCFDTQIGILLNCSSLKLNFWQLFRILLLQSSGLVIVWNKNWYRALWPMLPLIIKFFRFPGRISESSQTFMLRLNGFNSSSTCLISDIFVLMAFSILFLVSTSFERIASLMSTSFAANTWHLELGQSVLPLNRSRCRCCNATSLLLPLPRKTLRLSFWKSGSFQTGSVLQSEETWARRKFLWFEL